MPCADSAARPAGSSRASPLRTTGAAPRRESARPSPPRCSGGRRMALFHPAVAGLADVLRERGIANRYVDRLLFETSHALLIDARRRRRDGREPIERYGIHHVVTARSRSRGRPLLELLLRSRPPSRGVNRSAPSRFYRPESLQTRQRRPFLLVPCLHALEDREHVEMHGRCADRAQVVRHRIAPVAPAGRARFRGPVGRTFRFSSTRFCASRNSAKTRSALA